MVKVAHFSDTHLGHKQYNLDEREQDIYDALDEIARRIKEEHVDVIVHSGDLFDTSRPTPQAYRAFKKFLSKVDKHIPIFAVLGDHDRPKSRGLPPHALFDDRVRVLGVEGAAEQQTIKIDGKDVLIAGLSNLSYTYRDLLVTEMRKLAKLSLNPLSILLLHEGIDKFFKIKEACELAWDDVPKNFGYIAMGHLHSRIKASYGTGMLGYAGSSEIIRKDEIADWEKNGKGLYIVDLDEKTQVRNVNLECIRPQVDATLSYLRFDSQLLELAGKLDTTKKKPVVNVCVEGTEINRQAVYQSLNDALAGKALIVRPEIVDTTHIELPKVERGAFQMEQVLQAYFKNEDPAGLAVEMFKHLKQGEIDEARRLADEYFKRAEKNDNNQS